MRAAVLVGLAACSFEHGTSAIGTRSDGPVDDARIDAMTDAGGGSGSDVSQSPLRQKIITITGTVTGMHTDFPLWVSLADTDLAARARNDGTDIHFVAGATKLDFEIQSWTKNSGRLDAWVRVPSLATNTQIAIRYGDVTAAHPPNAPGTFSGYNAVWHLDDALSSNTIRDARNLTNGTAIQLNATDSIAGKLGRGIDFNDGNEQVMFTNPLSGNTSHTISAWISQRATTSNDAIIVIGNGAQNSARWFHSRYDDSTVAVGFYGNDYPDPGIDIIGKGFALLHWVYDGTTRTTRLYRNGVSAADPFVHSGGVNTQGTGGTIGNAQSAFGQNMGINATLDEVRIIDVARSAGWIAAEAANQGNPSTFYSVSAEQIP